MAAVTAGAVIFSDHLARIVRAEDGERELTMISGACPPRRVTNVRDKVLSSRFWRNSFEQRRCLVPASSFCEPRSDVKAVTWHWFALRGDGPRPLFAFPDISEGTAAT